MRGSSLITDSNGMGAVLLSTNSGDELVLLLSTNQSDEGYYNTGHETV